MVPGSNPGGPIAVPKPELMSTDAHKKRLIFLAVLIAALAFLALDMVRPFFRPLILASVITIGCYPLHALLLRPSAGKSGRRC